MQIHCWDNFNQFKSAHIGYREILISDLFKIAMFFINEQTILYSPRIYTYMEVNAATNYKFSGCISFSLFVDAISIYNCI